MIYYSHIFFVSVRNFVCKMTEDAELLMTLYDAKENRAITENYVVKWSKEGLASDINQLHNLRVLFTVSIKVFSNLSELVKNISTI